MTSALLRRQNVPSFAPAVGVTPTKEAAMKKTSVLIDETTAEAMRQLLTLAKFALDHLDRHGYRQDYLQASAIIHTAEQRLRAAARRRS